MLSIVDRYLLTMTFWASDEKFILRLISVSIFSQRAWIHRMPVIGGFLNIMYEMNGRQPSPKTFSPRLLAPNMKHLCCFRQTLCNSQKVYSAEEITES